MRIFYILVISLQFLIFLQSCNTHTPLEKFIVKHGLEKYDSVYVISCISCGGCLQGYFDNKNINNNMILVFDDKCKSEFIRYFKKYRHVSVPQNELDTVFHNFGNMKIVIKEKKRYIMSDFPKY